VQISSAISSYFSALGNKPGLYLGYLWRSIALSIGLLAAYTYGALNFTSSIGKYLAEKLPGQWQYESIVFGTITFLLGLAISLILLKYIVLILLSPYLSKVSRHATEDRSTISASVLSEMSRSIWINLRNMALELFYTLVLLLLGFIPGLAIITVPLAFVIQAYYTGFGIVDFYNERHTTYAQAIALCRKHKWGIMTIGAIYMIIFVIPVIGILTIPYFATIAGSHYMQQVSHSRN
jgi:CysZ protein